LALGMILKLPPFAKGRAGEGSKKQDE